MHTERREESRPRLSPLAAGLWAFAAVLAAYVVVRLLVG